MGTKKAKRNRFDISGAKNAETLAWDDFATRFKPKLHKPFARAKDQLTPILLFASKKTVFEGDLVLGCTTPNVVVQGELVVRGNIVMRVDEGFGTFLWVTGNLEADCISLEGFPGTLRRRERGVPSRDQWTTTPEYERSSPTPPASKRPSLLAKLFGGGKATAPASPEQQSTELSTARRAAVVVKALRDENGFNVPRSRRLRAVWKALGNHGEAQVGHLGSPHCFVRAESFTSMMPQLAITNLRDEKADLLRRAEKAKAAKPGPSPAT